ANINSYINSVPNIKFYNKDIFIYSDKNKFDLIIMNPPFLDDISCDESKPIDSYGGKEGLEFTIKVIKKIFKILKNKGEAHIITRTYIKYREDQLLKKIAVLMDLNKKFFEIDYTYLTKSAEKSTKGTSYKMIYLILKNNNRNKIKIKKGNYIFSLSHHF
ncbi:MAG: methyltransferase, partial [Spirochaetes bacterium]|nr:methyltransferase [Spirochaetota bacterium]